MSSEPPDRPSLPPGRRQSALTPQDERKILDIFRALDYDGRLEFEYHAGARTRFVVRPDGESEEGLIIVGPDIFPGNNVANPNSVLDAFAAAAHEITHYMRWQQGFELAHGRLTPLDEAMTSLQAFCTYKKSLSQSQLEQLVSDAMARIVEYVSSQEPGDGDASD